MLIKDALDFAANLASETDERHSDVWAALMALYSEVGRLDAQDTASKMILQKVAYEVERGNAQIVPGLVRDYLAATSSRT